MSGRVIGIICALCIPTISHGAVVINEIAWMGTAVNANDEWIELHNTGDSSVSLDGWTLSDGVSLSIGLAGAVGAGDYALLERTDDTTVPDVTAFQFYAGALANDGRTLTLTRNDGGTEDSVAGGTDWTNIGGNNETKETAQWTGTQWVTGTATPGRQNVSEGSAVEEEEDEESDTTNDTTSGQTVSTARSSSGGGGGSSKKQQPPVKKEPPVLALEVNAPQTAYVNQEVSFEVVPSGVGDAIRNSLTYTWNFGDTYTGVGKKPTHVFTYPGEYIVVAEGGFAKQHALARHEITVRPVSFVLGTNAEGNATVQNSAKYEVDLGGFTLRGSSTFTFPKYTFLRAGGTLTVPKVQVRDGEQIALYDTQRALAASYGSVVQPPPRTLTYAKTPVVTSDEVSIQSDKTEVKEVVVPQEAAVIQIGGAKKEEQRGIAQFFKKFVSFFGL